VNQSAGQKPQVYFEDVTVGMEIPQLVKGPYALMNQFKFGAMIGDFYPTHYDHKWATEVDRVPSVVVFGLQLTTHVSQLLTDWISPEGMLRKFSNRNRNKLYIEETLIIKGKVARKYEAGKEHLVECEIRGEKADGTLVVEGEATVALPSSLTISDTTHQYRRI
jgi:acyl dehydratase